VTKLSQAQLVYVLLFLVLFPLGVAQLFFADKIQEQLLRLRHYLQSVYEHHPILLKVFGPPLKTLTLRGYTVGKRIGGAIVITISIWCLISAFLPPDPCDSHYWSITKRTDPCH
jgi:hypothetical protein